MFNIGVYVTSRYADYVEFKNALNEAIKKYIPVGKPNALCTGSAKSNSSGNGLVRRYAFENGIPCRIFETQWEKHIPTKPGKRNTAGVRANAMIVKNSNGCCMFWTPTSVAKWDFMSGGCYNFRKMCGKMGRELIPIKVDIYKPLTKEEPQEKGKEAEEMPIGDIGSSRRASDLIGGGSSIPSATVVGGGGGRSAPSLGGAPSTPSVGGGSASSPMPSDGGSISAPPSAQSAAAAAPSVGSAPDISGGVVDLPVDVTGDGNPDVTIPAVDTNGDNTPDSMVVPVDTDGNGTADTVKVEPIPPQIMQNVTPTAAATAPTPSITTAAPQTSNAPVASTNASDDEETNNNQ